MIRKLRLLAAMFLNIFMAALAAIACFLPLMDEWIWAIVCLVVTLILWVFCIDFIVNEYKNNS